MHTVKVQGGCPSWIVVRRNCSSLRGEVLKAIRRSLQRTLFICYDWIYETSITVPSSPHLYCVTLIFQFRSSDPWPMLNRASTQPSTPASTSTVEVISNSKFTIGKIINNLTVLAIIESANNRRSHIARGNNLKGVSHTITTGSTLKNICNSCVMIQKNKEKNHRPPKLVPAAV